MTKKTANDNKTAKAIVVRTSEQAIEQFNELNAKVNVEEWLSATKNGAYKLTTSKPENSDDNKGSLKVGNATYYLVSAGTTKTAILISFRSYLVYILKREAVANRLANFPTFEEWCKKQENDWSKLAAVGLELSDEQKHKLYDNAKAKLGTTDDDNDDDE